jgi:hypothetical protein
VTASASFTSSLEDDKQLWDRLVQQGLAGSDSTDANLNLGWAFQLGDLLALMKDAGYKEFVPQVAKLPRASCHREEGSKVNAGATVSSCFWDVLDELKKCAHDFKDHVVSSCDKWNGGSKKKNFRESSSALGEWYRVQSLL